MKRTIKILVVILSSFFFHACQKDKVPAVITTEVTNVLATSATSGGTITDEGSGSVVERGICWSKGITPTILDNKTLEGGGAGTFICNMTNLEGATAYFVRAYAKNAAGIGYGKVMSFTTLGSTPYVTALPATNITVNTATFNGTVNASFLPTIVTFEYGTTDAYGQSDSYAGEVIGNQNISVSADQSELNPGTTYHFRIKAENSLGITYSEDISFTTLGQAPAAITLDACCLSTTGAKLNGTINANYLSATVTFEYVTTTAYGTSITASQSPVEGNITTSVSAYISGLNPGTIYHFRVKAENSLGTIYSDDMSFTSLLIIGTLADIEGNTYDTVNIGTQIWLAGNLKTTLYNDGTAIPLVTDGAVWAALSTPGYCWYNNDGACYEDTYGALYNWYAVNTGMLCPSGWHVPSVEEWITLVVYLGGHFVAADKLKEAGIAHWNSPNTGATNESGFTALPGGVRDNFGGFGAIGNTGFWWSTTEFDAETAIDRQITKSSSRVYDYPINKNVGFSVRCIMDK